MRTEPLKLIGRGLQIVVSVAAAALLIWSFYWFLTRPFRKEKLTADQVLVSVVHWGEKNEDQILENLIRDFESIEENRKILVALRKKDAGLVEEAVRNHIHRAAEIVNMKRNELYDS